MLLFDCFQLKIFVIDVELFGCVENCQSFFNNQICTFTGTSMAQPIYGHEIGYNLIVADESNHFKKIFQRKIDSSFFKSKGCDLLSMLMFSTFPALNYVFVSQPSHSGLSLWPPCRISQAFLLSPGDQMFCPASLQLV